MSSNRASRTTNLAALTLLLALSAAATACIVPPDFGVARLDARQVAEPIVQDGAEVPPEGDNGGGPRWESFAVFVVFLVVFLVFLAGAMVMAGLLSTVGANESGLRIRYPDVEKVYKRSLVLANIAAFFPFAGCSVAAAVPMLIWIWNVGSESHLVVAGVVIFAAGFAGYLFGSNWTGLVGNARIEASLRQVMAEHDQLDNSAFVGVFEPTNKSIFNQMFDTHDDIGLLYLAEEHLVFEGARYRRVIPRTAFMGLRRPLVWQFVYLGSRWLAIDYRIEGSRRSLYIESRERSTIRGNHRATGELEKTVTGWARRQPRPTA